MLWKMKNQEKEKKRKKEEEKRRSSRSIEREKRRKDEEERRMKFYNEAMSQNSKSMPCMPQKLGEARGSGKLPEDLMPRSRTGGSFSDQKQDAHDEKVQWNSGDEAYDEFGRLKRSKK